MALAINQFELLPNPMLLIADELVDVRAELEQLDERSKELGKRKEQLEQQLLDMMITEECDKFTRNGNTFFPTVKTHASIKADCKEYAYEWLKDNGFGDLVKEQVNAQSLTSWYKEQAEAGELPEYISGMLHVYEKATITVRKGRK